MVSSETQLPSCWLPGWLSAGRLRRSSKPPAPPATWQLASLRPAGEPRSPSTGFLSTQVRLGRPAFGELGSSCLGALLTPADLLCVWETAVWGHSLVFWGEDESSTCHAENLAPVQQCREVIVIFTYCGSWLQFTFMVWCFFTFADPFLFVLPQI